MKATTCQLSRGAPWYMVPEQNGASCQSFKASLQGGESSEVCTWQKTDKGMG